MEKLFILILIGANGFTIKVENENFVISYSHISPNYIVNVGEYVQKGQVIGHVGPKYVNGVANNPYKDSSGKSTNGATTGTHLHFSIKKDGQYINPFDYLCKK